MSDSDSSPGTPPSLSNPPPESSEIAPSSAQPPPDESDVHFPSLESTTLAREAQLDIPKSDATPETPESDVPPETPESDVPPENTESDGPPETPESDVSPETPESDVSPESPESTVPPETPESDVPPETPESDVPPETPESDVSPDTVTSDVPPEIQASDDLPPIRPSHVPPPIPRADVATPPSDAPPPIPPFDGPPRIPPPDGPPPIPPSNGPPPVPPSDGPPPVTSSDSAPPILQSDAPPEIPPFDRPPPRIPSSNLPPKSPQSPLPHSDPPSRLPPRIPPPHVRQETSPSDVPPEISASEIRNGSPPETSAAFDTSTPTSEVREGPKKTRLGHQASSFSYPSSLKPEHEHLKYTLSSPAIPYNADDDMDIDLSEPSKYSPHTRSPSDGSDVRWYFCKTPLRPDEAAASVPSTELVGKGEYFRFSKSDSDALEAAFLEREEELVRAWWKEYAESREGPSNGNSTHDSHSEEAGHLSQAGRNDFESGRMLQLNAWEKEENVGVLVKGGLYEVDLLSRRCLPVYWRGDHRRVLRGHWFARKGGLDWLPMREDLSEQLEIAYESQIWRRRRFQPSGLYAARVNLHGATQGLHALFTGEDDSWEAWLCVDTTGISFVLGLRGGGVKLRRGFALPEAPQPTQDEVRQHKEEELDDYASKVPVRHVVFMVHGIGQRLEKANLVDDVGAFRRSVAMLAEQHLTKYQQDSQRILFIPCQWRRELKLGGESSVEECTLEGVRGLRTMLSATVHDVLYYMSPVYCQDIIDSVSRSLNRLYRKFIKRNPNYDGKVSIYGHSLGTVLSYDILCHQTDQSSTSTAPMVSFETDVKKSQNRTDESEASTAPTAEVDPDVSETGEKVLPSSDSSDIENGASSRDDSDHSSSGDDNSEKVSEAEKDVEAESHRARTELECDADGVEPGETKLNDNEVEALKAEIKLLQEKLSALMQEKEESVAEKPGAPQPPPRKSLHASFSMRKNDDIRQLEGQGSAGSEDPQTTESPSLADTKDNQLDSRFNSKKDFTPYISYTKLDFEVDTFYAVGSPLGVFLSLRNIRIGVGRGQEYWEDDGIEEEMPAVRQMMNIFHPYDPVAYRVEPLVCKEFVKRRPKFVPYHKGGKRLHIGMQEFQEDLSARSKAIVQSISSVGTRVASAFISTPVPTIEEIETEKEKTYGAEMMERLTGSSEGRLDYQLQDSTFEHPYLAVLSSHTGYWHDLDTALFILKHLYKDIPKEPPPPPAIPAEHSKSDEDHGLDIVHTNSEVSDVSVPDEEGAKAAKSQEDSDPEEVSLTFSSKDKIAAVLADAHKVKADWMG